MAGSFDDASSQTLTASQTTMTAVPLTLACWANPDDLKIAMTAMSVYAAATNNWFRLLMAGTIGGDPVQAQTRNLGTVVQAQSSAGWSGSSGWAHIAGVFSAVDSRVAYYNGGNSGTESTSVTPAGIDTIAIGIIRPGTFTSYWSGQLAECAVWTAALDASEIAALAKGWKPDAIRPSALVFYNRLVRNLTRDLWGGLTLTNNGGVTVAAHPRIIEPMRRGVRKAAAVAAARRQRLPLLGVG